MHRKQTSRHNYQIRKETKTKPWPHFHQLRCNTIFALNVTFTRSLPTQKKKPPATSIMSAPRPQHRSSRVHTNGDDAVLAEEAARRIDFSDLMPTARQIETFNSYSTGNTPSPPSDSGEGGPDSYTPPMDTTALPARPASSPSPAAEGPGLSGLKKWIHSASTIPGRRALTGKDFAAWKEKLRNGGWSHEELGEGLVYAAHLIAAKKCDAVFATAAAAAGADVDGAFVPQTTSKAAAGFVTDMPLTTVPWGKANSDKVGRMSTMAVRSGILQALEALHEVEVRAPPAVETGVRTPADEVGDGRGRKRVKIDEMVGKKDSENEWVEKWSEEMRDRRQEVSPAELKRRREDECVVS